MCILSTLCWLHLKIWWSATVAQREKLLNILEPAILEIRYENVKLAKLGAIDKHLDNVNSC